MALEHLFWMTGCGAVVSHEACEKSFPMRSVQRCVCVCIYTYVCMCVCMYLLDGALAREVLLVECAHDRNHGQAAVLLRVVVKLGSGSVRALTRVAHT